MNEKELLQAISQIMDDKLKPIDDRLSNLKSDIQEIKNRTLKLEITQENVTNRNIQLLMEGHSQLASDMKEIKQKVNKIDDIRSKVVALEHVTTENVHSIKQLQSQRKI